LAGSRARRALFTIEGRMLKTKELQGETTHRRQFGREQLLRQLDLPARIDPKYAKAILENGVLNITAKRAPMTLASAVLEQIKSAKHSAA
jgi:HSP20 family molecular chaperone IbpA